MFIYRNDVVYTTSNMRARQADGLPFSFLPSGSRVTVMFGSRPNLSTDVLTMVTCMPVSSDAPIAAIADLFGVKGETRVEVGEDGKWIVPTQSLITKSLLDNLLVRASVKNIDITPPSKWRSGNTEWKENWTQERDVYTEKRTFHSSIWGIPETAQKKYSNYPKNRNEAVTLKVQSDAGRTIVTATDQESTYLGCLHPGTVESYTACLVDALQVNSSVDCIIGGGESPVYGIGLEVEIEYGTFKSQWRRVDTADDPKDYGDCGDYTDYDREDLQKERATVELSKSMFDHNDRQEDETAEGLGVGEITTEDADNEY